MPRPNDTIAALATPVGTAALAVVRISGPGTPDIATAMCGRLPRARTAIHVDYVGVDGGLIDDVIITFYPNPRSYTGEDALEISSHGNPFIAQKILDDLFARGCRPADAGEFTQRAFLNGRLDLSQAEAVMDLINAQSDRALAAANSQRRGALGQRMNTLTERLLGVLAQIEAYIDFPDEDLPPENRTHLVADVSRITLSTNDLLATSHQGKLLRDGIRTVILGAPNAGKSSLLNALVGSDRALVSAEPGTTRDFIEERIRVGPHWVRLIDTAGLNASPAPLEKLGIAKTLERVMEADLFLTVYDANDPSTPPFPTAVQESLSAKNVIAVLNKSDLPARLPHGAVLPHFAAVSVSSLQHSGLDKLRATICQWADGFAGTSDVAIAINSRHAHALIQARDALQAATEKLEQSGPVELIASDLRAALAAFGEIVGRVDNERMLDQLFATFCIGK